jgi:hypothetical protein
MPSSAKKEQFLAAAGPRAAQRSGKLLDYPRGNEIMHPVLLVAFLAQMRR